MFSVSKIFLLLFFLCFLSGCADKQYDKNSEDLAELKTIINEMREEQRLILKEVISLQKKLESAGPIDQRMKDRAIGQVSLPDNDRLLGQENAEYAMIEFMDYQCAYCVRYARQVLPTIKKRYVDTGKLKYSIRDFPLSFHSKAEGAAIAANCAGEQSKYWPMHDHLVANFKSLNSDLYNSLATKLGLDQDVFSSCLADPESKKAVEADVAYGAEIGIRGTPNFYIGKIEGDSIVNVVHISGARSVDAFDRAIQQAMSIN